jgi:DNA gyrase subunit B
MLASKEIKALVIALGAAIAEEFDISKLRYHKIIIATDADVDGAHIRTLLLTLFYRYYLPVIDGGYLYIALPPLFRIQKGKEVIYAYSEEEKDKMIGKDGQGFNIQRYKGLGEMNPEQLWETTIDPARRVLKQVTVDDAEEADKTFDILMGKEVEPRKIFIQTHAQKVQNLDV